MESGVPSPPIEFKVVVLGDKGVGKTCLVLRFIEGYFAPKQQSTIGAFFLTKKITATDGTVCKMQIWDTAGQERFRAMAPMYYRNAAVAIVCFDIMDEESFQKMKDWVEELKTNVPEGKLVLAIACNKTDMESRRVVSKARAEQFAASVNALLCETSAKENWGVNELFSKVCDRVMETRGDELKGARGLHGARTGRSGSRSKFGLSPAANAAGFRESDDRESRGCC
ncbi:unnamed protein product [Discosporangium mesarthrocarpum]